MNLFFLPEISVNESYQLSDDECRHLIKVKRAKDGDLVQLTDGKGRLATAKLSFRSKSKAFVLVNEVKEVHKEGPNLTIAISPIKSPSRWEWFLEKATELGIDKIQPIICTRTEKQNFKKERQEKIILSAIKQSNRYYLPELLDPISIEEFLKRNLNGQRFIAHCEETKRISLYDNLMPASDLTILIGPEGDFTKNEIEMSVIEGFQPVSLGKYRLRTETAGIIVCQSFNFVNRL